uniref:vasoactive intestinal polypeptide receptor 2 n=1 Tax=Callospermophilus lateralis TaxID=76772 RepID=UPI004038A606
MRAPALLTCCCWLLVPVNSIHPECRFHLEIQEEETKCAELLRSPTAKHTACPGVWDNITCWRPAEVGETVTVPCPQVFSHFYSRPGNISKNCTSEGWSEAFPDFIEACGYSDPEDEGKMAFYVLVKAIYTLGYSVSLVSLATGSMILCLFRKLHCTRNYIHLNLFLSFILRAISVLVKDNVLYSSSGTLHCPDQPSSWTELQMETASSSSSRGKYSTIQPPSVAHADHSWPRITVLGNDGSGATRTSGTLRTEASDDSRDASKAGSIIGTARKEGNLLSRQHTEALAQQGPESLMPSTRSAAAQHALRVAKHVLGRQSFAVRAEGHPAQERLQDAIQREDEAGSLSPEHRSRWCHAPAIHLQALV